MKVATGAEYQLDPMFIGQLWELSKATLRILGSFPRLNLTVMIRSPPKKTTWIHKQVSEICKVKLGIGIAWFIWRLWFSFFFIFAEQVDKTLEFLSLEAGSKRAVFRLGCRWGNMKIQRWWRRRPDAWKQWTTGNSFSILGGMMKRWVGNSIDVIKWLPLGWEVVVTYWITWKLC